MSASTEHGSMDTTTENLGDHADAILLPSSDALPDVSASAEAPATVAYPIWVPHPPSPPSPLDNDAKYIAHKRRQVKANPKALADQSIKIAKIALDYYGESETNKTKFELLEVRPVIYVPTKWRPYIHINFIARSREQGSPELFFFAELYLCGKRKSPSGYSVTCCEPLGDDTTAGRIGMDNPRGDPPASTKNIDEAYCFACNQRMLHPEGTKYAGGHCNVPGIYNDAAFL